MSRPRFAVKAVLGAALALARRIQGHAAGDPELAADMAELKDQVDLLRRQLEETQERVDFAERLLSQQRSAVRIPDAGA